MASRRDVDPTPEELRVWLGVVSPRTAHGRMRWTDVAPDARWGWTSYGDPVFAMVPPDVEVEFWYGGWQRWRLEGPDGFLAVSSPEGAVARNDGELVAADDLLVPNGPRLLLMPDSGGADGDQPSTLTRDTLLGRDCWRWEQRTGIRWVDIRTGCLLRERSPRGQVELTSLEWDAPVPDELFRLPIELPRSTPVPPAEVSWTPATAGFRIGWWPFAPMSSPRAGDPDVPTLLVEVAVDAEPQWWVGVAPLGVGAPTEEGAPSQRWTGDDCELALSWSPGADPAEVDRVVASIPRSWS